MDNITETNQCFVCGTNQATQLFSTNKRTNLPVCQNCKGTEDEIKAENDALDSLSEGFVCGCI